MRGKRIFSAILICLMCLSGVCFLTAAGTAGDKQELGNEQHLERAEILIPTVDDVRANGYPTNEMGQTYGPDIKENTDAEAGPELILACGENGVEGYVRAEDLNYDPVETQEEVLEYQATREDQRRIPLYMEDGKTVIGSFVVDNRNISINPA